MAVENLLTFTCQSCSHTWQYTIPLESEDQAGFDQAHEERVLHRRKVADPEDETAAYAAWLTCSGCGEKVDYHTTKEVPPG